MARTEEDIAKTMHGMARQRTGAAAERRRTLAEEAMRGVRTAAEHGERLQRLASHFIEYARISAMRRLLHHAGTTLEELARTERAIAGAFDDLACHDGSAVADERRRLSRVASAAADSALLRAQDLHRLARDLAPSGTTPLTR